jgi:hypothetical protein
MLVIRNVVHGIYIDDLFLLSTDHAAAIQVHEAALAAYVKYGLLSNKKKTVEPTTDPVTVIGVEVHGAASTVGVNVHSLLKLIETTLLFCKLPRVTGHQLSILIGHWTWNIIIRRPMLSILRHVYRFINIAKQQSFYLWKSVRNELLLLCMLAPLIQVNLNDHYCQSVIASDASCTGGVHVVNVKTNIKSYT